MNLSSLNLPLQHLYRAPLAAAAQGAEPGLLVLMHGVGSNAQDLFSLAPYVPAHWHVLSLQAPFAMGWEAYAWFMFSVQHDGTRLIDVQQERESRALLARTVQAAAQQLGVTAAQTVVGGFSQGGIMSLSLLLSQPELLGGICVWHSRLLPEAVAEQVEPECFQGRRAWISHGTQDDVIALASAQAIRDHLQVLPVELNYREYPCTHTIHPQELHESMQWLQAHGASR